MEFKLPPRLLFHYCSLDSFIKIITENKIRLYNVKQSNDSQEIIWIKNLKAPLFFDIKSEFIKGEIEASINEGIKDNGPYVFCFSEEGDLLSQWRGYANDASGVSIGFDPRDLELSIRSSFKEPKTMNIEKILYSHVEQFRYLKGLCSNLKFNSHGELKSDSISIEMFRYLIKKFVIKIKNEAFKEEREYRLIYQPGDGNNKYIDRKPSYDCINNQIREYYNFKPPLKVSEYIREIYIGSKCKTNYEDMSRFLVNNGFDLRHTKLRPSASTYI